MRELHIDIRNKIATYSTRGGAIVCGNNDYTIRFSFDSEWNEYESKTVRFIWNDKYIDVVIIGDTVPVPMLSQVTELTVGVYAGEKLYTTTPAKIPCLLSVLCESDRAKEADYYEVNGTLEYRLPVITPEDDAKILQAVNGVYELREAPDLTMNSEVVNEVLKNKVKPIEEIALQNKSGLELLNALIIDPLPDGGMENAGAMLATDDKTIVGGINELNDKLDTTTTIVFKDEIELPKIKNSESGFPESKQYADINFVSNNQSFTSISVIYTFDAPMLSFIYFLRYDDTTVYYNGWVDPAYQTIATNDDMSKWDSELLSWVLQSVEKREKDLEIYYQPKVDLSLPTQVKTTGGAINELCNAVEDMWTVDGTTLKFLSPSIGPTSLFSLVSFEIDFDTLEMKLTNDGETLMAELMDTELAQVLKKFWDENGDEIESFASAIVNEVVKALQSEEAQLVKDAVIDVIEVALGMESDIDTSAGKLFQTIKNQITKVVNEIFKDVVTISKLPGRMDTAEADIDALQSDLNELESSSNKDIETVKSRVSTVEEQVDVLSTVVGAMQKIWKLKDDVSGFSEVHSGDYDINFVSNGTNFIQLILDYEVDDATGEEIIRVHYTTEDGDLILVYDASTNETNKGWKDTAYQNLVVLGGKDASNATLLSWVTKHGAIEDQDVLALSKEYTNEALAELEDTINGVNDKTVDKIKFIDTYEGDGENTSSVRVNASAGGITWKDTVRFEMNNSDEATASMFFKTPIEAGDNIEFKETTNENDKPVIKINATGGVDTITHFESCNNEREIYPISEDGITWCDKGYFTKDDDSDTKMFTQALGVPIVAGDNVEFEVDEENQVVKINTKGGDTSNLIPIVRTGGTGEVYTATIEGLTELKMGFSFVMIPHTPNTVQTPKLNINNLGELPIYRKASDNSSVAYLTTSFFGAGNPVRLLCGGSIWIVESLTQPIATDIRGRVPVANGGVPTIGTNDDGKVLTVEGTTAKWKEPAGGSVDTSNLATVDKVKSIDTYCLGAENVGFDDGDGIYWEDGFDFNSGADIDGETLTGGKIYHRIPIAAGNGVEFEIEGNQIVKINATGGSADTSNLATADKIKEIDTWAGEKSEVEENGVDGITWKDQFMLMDESSGDISSGEIYHRIPIMAGDNVTLTVDEANQVVKINAEGGSNENTVFKHTISTNHPTPYISEVITSIQDAGGDITVLNFISFTGYFTGSYLLKFSWSGGNMYRVECIDLSTLTRIYDPATNNFVDASTTTIEDFIEAGTPKEEMPQIRFTGANGYTGNMFKFATSGSYIVVEYDDDGAILFSFPLYFTVEIVSGALQVGDQLQLCKRTTFMGCESNDFRCKKKLKRVAEYVVTEDDLDKRFLTVAANAGVQQVYKALLNDGYGGNGGVNMSPLYLRIRRPKGELQNNDSGQTVDATFSNVETIWKKHHRGQGQVKII